MYCGSAAWALIGGWRTSISGQRRARLACSMSHMSQPTAPAKMAMSGDVGNTLPDADAQRWPIRLRDPGRGGQVLRSRGDAVLVAIPLGSGAFMQSRSITVQVNGEAHERAVEPRLLLSDFLRHDLGLTGTHVGCEHGVCGACTVLLDGAAVRSCLLFAVQADGHEVTTVEALAGSVAGRPAADGVSGEIVEGAGFAAAPALHPLQAAFREAHALQCGFCTPGILMTLVPFLRENPTPGRPEIRRALGANLCRCTGYQNIVDAVERAIELMAP